jgi:hypothetical protein
MIIAQQEVTWAGVDQMNRTHYGRGKPALLLRCEELAEMYRQEMRAADDYPPEYLTGYIDVMDMQAALYDAWQAEYNRHWSDDPKYWAEDDHWGELEGVQ